MSDSRNTALKAGCGLVVAGLLAMVLWFALAPAPESGPQVVKSPQERVRKVIEEVPAIEAEAELPKNPALDPTSIRMAVDGDLGLAMRNRVCRVCIGGVLDDESCRRCGDYADAGRLVFDIVDLEGRPYDESATVVTYCAARYATGPSGFVDLPAGPCKVAVHRFAEGFRSSTATVEVEITTDEETYHLFELATGPVGGVGVKLDYEDGAFRVIDLIGSYTGGQVPVGAEILAVDGEPVGLQIDRVVGDPRSLLPGPVGSEVEVRIGYEGESGWVEETVVLERHAIETHEIGLGGTPG